VVHLHVFSDDTVNEAQGVLLWFYHFNQSKSSKYIFSFLLSFLRYNLSLKITENGLKFALYSNRYLASLK